MKRIPSHQFTTEYKNEAVKLVFDQQIQQAQVARQLGVSIKSRHNWVTQHRVGQLKGSQGVDKLAPTNCVLVNWSVSSPSLKWSVIF
jgi:transposase-like protein